MKISRIKVEKRLTNPSAYYNIVFAIANAPIAQSVEHAAVNRSVIGSSPIGGAKIKKRDLAPLFFILAPPIGARTRNFSSPRKIAGAANAPPIAGAFAFAVNTVFS